MKNLKVGTKIIAGSGVSIIMILIIMVVIFLSNTETAKDIEVIRINTVLLSDYNDFVEHYWEARVEATALLTSLDPNVYQKTLGHVTAAYQSLDEMRDHIGNNEILSSHNVAVDAIEGDLTKWKIAIDSLGSSNAALAEAILRSREQQQLLRNAAGLTYDNQLGLWSTEAFNEEITAEDRLRRGTRLDETVGFIRMIEALVGDGEYMFSSRDTLNGEAFVEEMDRIIDLIQENGDVARNQGTQDTAYATVAALKEYQSAFLTFYELNLKNKSDIETLASSSLDNILILLSSLNDSVLSAVDSTAAINRFSQSAISVIVIISVFVSVLISVYISRIISKPLGVLTAFMKKAGSTGDILLNAQDVALIEKVSKNKDEIGQTIAATASFVEHVTNVSGVLGLVADGDLTTEIQVISDSDIMGNSLKHMIDNLNRMFTEINLASAKVLTDSELIKDTAQSIAQGNMNIAEGAQLLAIGSTDQASSVQSLSESVNNIAEKTKTNAELADQASKLADTIIGNAEKGSQQMNDMIQAVNDITLASREISTIIETINEIASQTNLLSLNAAIEAARAGENGRGFAVVASEVGKLAFESTEAAKETNDKIQTSIGKAELGAKIVEETAVSLKEIIAGINESSRLVKEIADASTEQLAHIKEVNNGINQVSEVVEQNSATAEESAAAAQESAAASNVSADTAEEMRDLSSNLHKLVAQFKIKSGLTTQ